MKRNNIMEKVIKIIARFIAAFLIVIAFIHTCIGVSTS